MARPRRSIVKDTVEVPALTPAQNGNGQDTDPAEPDYSVVQVASIGSAPLDRIVVALPSDGTYSIYTPAWLRVLPPYIDDIDRDFSDRGWSGNSIYDTMLTEPSAAASVGLLMASAIPNRPPRFHMPVKRGDPDFDLAVRIKTFVDRNVSDLSASFLSRVRELTKGGFSHGHKIGRKVYEVASSPAEEVGGSALYLKDIRPKPNVVTALVVDSFNTFLGVKFIDPQLGFTLSPYNLISETDNTLDDVEPPSLLALAAHEPRNMDPRGTSGLRAAYHPWWMLQQIYKSKLSYLALYGTPPIFATTPPNVKDQRVDPRTGLRLDVPKPATEVMRDNLIPLRSAGIVVAQNGSTATLLQPAGDGQFYETSSEAEHVRIALAILYQELATMEGRHQARAASQVHQDALDIRVRSIRAWVEEFIFYQIVVPLVVINFGPKARRLCPYPNLGEVELRDLPALASVLAQMVAAGAIPLDILNWLLELIGFPESQALSDILNDDPTLATAPLFKTKQGASSPGVGSVGGMGAIEPPQPPLTPPPAN